MPRLVPLTDFVQAPLGGGEHDFQAQFARLVEYAEKHSRALGKGMTGNRSAQ